MVTTLELIDNGELAGYVENARELLNLGKDQPLKRVFSHWCKPHPPTMRKARAFLAERPEFRG